MSCGQQETTSWPQSQSIIVVLVTNRSASAEYVTSDCASTCKVTLSLCKLLQRDDQARKRGGQCHALHTASHLQKLPVTDGMRALVHIQGRSDAMAGAVPIVQPLAPQGGSGKAVQGQSRRPLGEDGLVDRNVALDTHYGSRWQRQLNPPRSDALLQFCRKWSPCRTRRFHFHEFKDLIKQTCTLEDRHRSAWNLSCHVLVIV